MANVDAAYGLRPVRSLSGGNVCTNVYVIISGYGTNIFMGDPVRQATTGGVQLATAGSTNVMGVFAGCSYVDAQGNAVFSKMWPANTIATDIEAFVYDDPSIIFRIQSDATGVGVADIGAKADWEIVAGDPAIGISRANLDASAFLAGGPASMRVLRIIDEPGNEPGPFADVEVQFAEHVYNTVGSGV